MALTCLPMFGEVRAIKFSGESKEVALDETDKKKLEMVNKALFRVKIIEQKHNCLVGEAFYRYENEH